MPAVTLDADGFADVPLDGSPVQGSRPQRDEPQAPPSTLPTGMPSDAAFTGAPGSVALCDWGWIYGERVRLACTCVHMACANI